MTIWIVKYQYQILGQEVEIYTEEVKARDVDIVDGHLVFYRDNKNIYRAFAPDIWIEVKLKNDEQRTNCTE